jgi:hypothetical protein
MVSDRTGVSHNRMSRSHQGRLVGRAITQQSAKLLQGGREQGAVNDSEAQRRISPLLAQDRSENREAAESRDLQDARGCRAARACSPVFQAPRLTLSGRGFMNDV